MNTSNAIISKNKLSGAEVSINFQRLEESQLVSYFNKKEHIEDVFRELIRRFQQRVYVHVRNMIVAHEPAHQITIQIFAKMWEGMHAYRESELIVWIYRLATNETIAYLRKQNPQIDFDEAQTAFADELVSAKDLTAENNQAINMQKALCYLPYKQKLVFVLHHFEGLAFEQIAELTQTSVTALEATCHHADKKVEIYLTALG